ncbi:unnamed protein product, partial [Rotaria sp. Silwood1]
AEFTFTNKCKLS